MTKEELIINDYYEKLYSKNNIDKTYLYLYDKDDDCLVTIDSDCDPIIEKQRYLFAYYHHMLNFYLTEINRRIDIASYYYTSEYSKILSFLMGTILGLLEAFKGTKYSFKMKDNYYKYISKLASIINPNGGTNLPLDLKKIVLVKYEPIFFEIDEKGKIVEVDSGKFNPLVDKINNGSQEFDNMENDEKLSMINQMIENILKKDKHYISIDEQMLFSGLITNENIKKYRTITNCFRHGSEEMLNERDKITLEQKIFLINYGLTICAVLLKEKS